MEFTKEEIQELLDELYEVKDKAIDAGNSKYTRVANKHILFAIWKDVKDIKKKNQKQDIEIAKLKRTHTILLIILPVITGIIGYVVK